MRKLNAKEIDEIKDALANGRQWDVDVEDFDLKEFGDQANERAAKRGGTEDEDANVSKVEVGGRSARSS